MSETKPKAKPAAPKPRLVADAKEVAHIGALVLTGGLQGSPQTLAMELMRKSLFIQEGKTRRPLTDEEINQQLSKYIG